MHRSYLTASVLQPHSAMRLATVARGPGSGSVAAHHQTFHTCDALASRSNQNLKVNAGNSLRLPEQRDRGGQATCTGLGDERTSSAATGVGRERWQTSGTATSSSP